MRFPNYKVLLFALFLLVVACGRSYEEQRRMSRAERYRLFREDSLALKIAVMPTLDCLPLYLMKDHQLYDTAQLDLRLKFFTAQMDCDTALLNRRVEGSISDLVRTERMKKRGLQLDYLTATNAYWQLYSNRKARLKHLNQLGDKMIAMTRFSATDYLTDLTLDTVKTRARVYRVQFNNVLTCCSTMRLMPFGSRNLRPQKPEYSIIRCYATAEISGFRSVYWPCDMLEWLINGAKCSCMRLPRPTM